MIKIKYLKQCMEQSMFMTVSLGECEILQILKTIDTAIFSQVVLYRPSAQGLQDYVYPGIDVITAV